RRFNQSQSLDSSIDCGLDLSHLRYLISLVLNGSLFYSPVGFLTATTSAKVFLVDRGYDANVDHDSYERPGRVERSHQTGRSARLASGRSVDRDDYLPGADRSERWSSHGQFASTADPARRTLDSRPASRHCLVAGSGEAAENDQR